jgi:hypothetical protein
MSGKPALMGIFSYLDDLLNALKAVKERDVKIDTVYSPIHRHEIIDALGLKQLSTVRFFTLAGGILGVLTGIGLVVYTSLQWKLIVGGKPVIPTVPTVIVAFEFCILFSILFNLLGWVIKSRMPKFSMPDHYDPRFTEDRFGVLVLCPEADQEEVTRILREAGAEEVHEVNR